MRVTRLGCFALGLPLMVCVSLGCRKTTRAAPDRAHDAGPVVSEVPADGGDSRPTREVFRSAAGPEGSMAPLTIATRGRTLFWASGAEVWKIDLPDGQPEQLIKAGQRITTGPMDHLAVVGDHAFWRDHFHPVHGADLRRGTAIHLPDTTMGVFIADERWLYTIALQSLDQVGVRLDLDGRHQTPFPQLAVCNRELASAQDADAIYCLKSRISVTKAMMQMTHAQLAKTGILDLVVVEIPKSGGAPKVLTQSRAGHRGEVRSLAVTNNDVYWMAGDPQGLWRVRKTGGENELVDDRARIHGQALFSDGERVTWVHEVDRPVSMATAIWSLPAGAKQPAELLRLNGEIDCVATVKIPGEAEQLVWCQDDAIYARPL